MVNFMNPDEETALIGDKKTTKLVLKFNIETLRFYGLIGGGVLLAVGYVFSTFFVKLPHYADATDIPDNIDPETYKYMNYWDGMIYHIFHFNHTCTFLDFNPSKTSSALIVMFSVAPLVGHNWLQYYRIKNRYDQGLLPKGLLTLNKVATPIKAVGFTFFYMVFVNSPQWDDMLSFTLHYIPYMIWQISLGLMALEQCWYIHAMRATYPIPYGITEKMMRVYLILILLVFIYYTVFIWSFILAWWEVVPRPILDTNDQHKKNFAKFIMFFFDLLTGVIPLIFAHKERKNGDDTVISIMNP